MVEIQFGSWRGEASRISDKFVLVFHSFSGFLINMNKHKMAKIINTTYQTNSFKIIKSTFIIYELLHAPIVFPISLGIFNCFENSDRSENFRQTVPIYEWWWAGCQPPYPPPPAPPDFSPLLSTILNNIFTGNSASPVDNCEHCGQHNILQSSYTAG